MIKQIGFSRNLRAVLVMGLLGSAALSITGCSSTPTHESAGEYTSDAGVTAHVKAALLQDPGLKSLEINVKTYRGEVQLSGFVNSGDQIQKAVAVTRSVEGVQAVNNDLAIKPQ
jgi:hyperosmotically inducible protein